MNIKTVSEKPSWKPRPDSGLLLLLKPEKNRYFNRSCQSNTQLVIPFFLGLTNIYGYIMSSK